MLFIVILLLLFSNISQGATVVSWGSNQYGQLGTGNGSDVSTPAIISQYNNVVIVNIRLGLSTHFAMTDDGSVYCCGNNIVGQLGINSQSAQYSPVKNTLAYGLDVYPIGPQTIAFNSTTKDVFGWGLDGGYMQGSSFSGNQLTPLKSTNSGFAGLVVGVSTAWSTSFVLLNGGAYAAGNAISYPQFVSDTPAKLGTAATADQPDFVRMSAWDNNPLLKLFPSDSSHVCALSKSYSLYCWGRNNKGQLGVGHTNDVNVPTLVSFFDAHDLYVAQVKTGDTHTVALTCGGKVYSWGNNARGNLGLGTQDSLSHPIPTLIGNLTSRGIIEISSSVNSIFARNSTNDWYVWGAIDNNIILMQQANDVLSPVVNPYFKQQGLTRIATNSKSSFAIAWNDAQPPTTISLDCPPIIDECALGMDNCALNTLCVDTERSYKCLCGAGFVGNGILVAAGGTGCDDIDECATNQCLPQATCVNQLGSFSCGCSKGYDGDGKINGTGCYDIDECKEGGYCTANTVCTNTVGSYTCACQTGYRQVSATPCGIICTDVDECNTQNTCGPNTICNNIAGGYNCPCMPGYSGSSCTDVNECTTGAYTCALPSYCVNLPGTYTCQCPAGFVGDGVSTVAGGSDCFDINECSVPGPSPCDKNAACTNSVGSFSCNCNSGFTGNGTTCTDVNECAGTNNCVSSANNGMCTNNIGNYTCGCQTGYTGNGIKTSVSGGTGCTDVNECASANKCDPAATCSNTLGSYNCSCPSGFMGSGFSCYTVNCAVGTYPNSSTTCAACPAGTYNDVKGAETCTQCPAGTYSAATGKSAASTCVVCPKGTYSTAGSKQCATCPPGTTSTTAGTCTPCPAGQFGSQGTCKNCGQGWFSSSSGAVDCEPCPPGYFASSNAATGCTICPAGSISKGKASSCDLCPAGRYAPKPGQYNCVNCPPGTFAQTNGSSSCTSCSPGSATPYASSTSCAACSQGTFTAANGATACSLCAPGSYQDQTGQSSCKTCSNWQYSETSGATNCTTCYQGYAGQYEYGSSACLACPPGTYRTAGPIPVCTPCFAGSATELAGQAHCSYCMGGYYAKKCGQTTCDACAPGTYSSFAASGANNCAYCPYAQASFGTAYYCYY